VRRSVARPALGAPLLRPSSSLPEASRLTGGASSALLEVAGGQSGSFAARRVGIF